MFKRFLSLIFSFILTLTSIIPTFANELGVENNNEEISIIHELEPGITNYSDGDNKEKLPNFIPITGKTFSFSLPMIKANTIYDVTVIVVKL